MKMFRQVSIAGASLWLSGCAQLDSLNWPVNLEGKAVALDAKQRVVISQRQEFGYDAVTRQILYKTVTCAEPSPDALSAYGASLAGTLKSDKAAQAQLAATLAEQSASIGLRTQSIQLMRDAMYRACEAYYGGGITRGQFSALQRRFQNLTLGLLAIEQLTGAVKADQVILNTSGGSSTGANTQVETAALASARTTQDGAKAELEAAQSQLAAALAVVTKAYAENAAAQATFSKIAAPSQANTDARDAAAKGAKDADVAYQEKKQAATNKQRAFDTATDLVKIAQDNLTAAQLQVRSTASGSGQLAMAVSRAQVTEKVSAAVKDIVKIVFDESGKGEGCNGIISDFLERSADYADSDTLMKVLNICLQAQQVATEAQATGSKLPVPERIELPKANPNNQRSIRPVTPAPAPPPSRIPSPD